MVVITFANPPPWNPFWGYMMWAMMAVAIAIPVAYVVWKIWVITKDLKAREAAGIKSDPPTPEDEANLTFICWMLGPGLVGTVLAVIFLPSPAQDWVVKCIPFLAMLGAALWLWLHRSHSRRA